MDLQNKTITELAGVIAWDWPTIPPSAKAYLAPMFSLYDITDNYYEDSGRSVILHFLTNASTWKGDVAREVKKELNRRLK